MAATSTLEKVSVNVLLNNGTQDGKVKTLSVSLGTLHPSRYEDQKAMDIANALRPCFAKPVFEVRKVEVSSLTEEA